VRPGVFERATAQALGFVEQTEQQSGATQGVVVRASSDDESSRDLTFEELP
jgi:hypothetical protein